MGPAVLNTPCPRRGVHDSIRDGANRIDAREPLSYAAAAGRLPQQTHRADISGVYVSTLGGRLCTKSHSVGGVSDADLAQLHTLVNVAAHYRGQRPLPQTFCAKPHTIQLGINVGKAARPHAREAND